MQKQVSKRGLAVLALSILLVLSLGLTATFAAFNKTANVSGTVSFIDSIQITDTTSSTINVEINVGSEEVTFSSGSSQLAAATITAGGAPFYWKATLSITAGNTYFTFDTSSIPQLNNTDADSGATSTQIVWKSTSPVTALQTLDIEDMLEGLSVILNLSNIGSAASPSGTLSLQIDAQYNAFA